MSLEFVGAYAPMHHQCFQMVDMLVHHFRWNMKKWNPSAKPYVPTTEVGEVNLNEEEQQQEETTRKNTEEKECGWTIPSKHANTRNTNDVEKGMPVSGKNNNMHNIFEHEEEEECDETKEHEDEDENNEKVDAVKEEKVMKYLIWKTWV